MHLDCECKAKKQVTAFKQGNAGSSAKPQVIAPVKTTGPTKQQRVAVTPVKSPPHPAPIVRKVQPAVSQEDPQRIPPVQGGSSEHHGKGKTAQKVAIPPVNNEAGYEKCMKKVEGGETATHVASAALGIASVFTFGITGAIGAAAEVGAHYGFEAARKKCQKKYMPAA